MRLRTGDLIFVHGSSWSELLSMIRFRSWWSHAAMYYGGGKTAEMTEKNFRMLTFKKRYEGKCIQVVRFKWVGKDQRRRIKKAVKIVCGAKFDRLRLMIPLLPQFRKNRLWCTTFIDAIYKLGTKTGINTAKIMRGDKKYLDAYQAVVVYDYRNN